MTPGPGGRPGAHGPDREAGLPRLHAVTTDAVLARPAFDAAARALLEAHGPAVALHLRGPQTSGRRLYDLAAALAPVARSTGAALLVNDRLDVALAAAADGVQLGGRSVAVATARQLGPWWLVGASVHGADEASRTAEADFLVVGTIWATPSHPGRPGAGVGRIREVRDRVAVPVVAIGGVTPARAAEAVAAGAAGVAVVRGVWDRDPAAAAGRYLAAMAAVAPPRGVGAEDSDGIGEGTNG